MSCNCYTPQECDRLGHSAENDAGVRWDHPLWFQSHPGRPDLSRQYVQRGTGNTEAPCLDCDMAVIRRVIPPGESDE